MVEIPPGSFYMGSTGGRTDERPVHDVTIGYSFYLSKYEVTQAQWAALMGDNPSHFKGDRLPVENVSWDCAQVFISKLNEMNDGYTYRLPTEAEWEYACRAGTTTAYAFGDTLNPEQANFNRYYKSQTTMVGSFRPNAFGLYDMHGNVWEWCEDTWHGKYTDAPRDGLAWVSGNPKYRVQRGGSWRIDASYLRSANRGRRSRTAANYLYGVRVAATLRSLGDQKSP
jgi:formylglycine-generating enzyme required for sulfatase activity